MEQTAEIPYCPPPTESVSDVVPLLVVAGVFLLFTWWRRQRKGGKRPGK